MSRFSAMLRRTAARLDLPQPVKSRVLLEMAAATVIWFGLRCRLHSLATRREENPAAKV